MSGRPRERFLLCQEKKCTIVVLPFYYLSISVLLPFYYDAYMMRLCFSYVRSLKMGGYRQDRSFQKDSLRWESMMMVTGPSLTRATCMLAPKVPVWISLPKRVCSLAMNFSYIGTAKSGREAWM